jgi:hypothetical protein
MFNPTLIVIEAFIRELRTMYERTYSTLEPDYPGVISLWRQGDFERLRSWRGGDDLALNLAPKH